MFLFSFSWRHDTTSILKSDQRSKISQKSLNGRQETGHLVSRVGRTAVTLTWKVSSFFYNLERKSFSTSTSQRKFLSQCWRIEKNPYILFKSTFQISWYWNDRNFWNFNKFEKWFISSCNPKSIKCKLFTQSGSIFKLENPVLFL